MIYTKETEENQPEKNCRQENYKIILKKENFEDVPTRVTEGLVHAIPKIDFYDRSSLIDRATAQGVALKK